MSQLKLIILLLICCLQQCRCQHDNEDMDFSNVHSSDRCEPIVIPLCEGIQYNQTIMPNLLGHTKQDAAGLELHQYMPLVKVQCSSILQIFLCSIYVPVCNVLEKPIPPCRSLCLTARSGCESLMNKFGFTWPDALDCAKFPAGSAKGDLSQICVGDPSDSSSTGLESNPAPYPSYPYPQNPSVKYTGYPRPNLSHELTFKCPMNFKTPTGLDYVFRIQGKEHKDCGMPCDELLVEPNERNYIRIFTGLWAIFCVISTGFTVLTYYIEPNRFNFPERSIIYLSWCYLFIGGVFVFGFFFGDTIACNEPFTPPYEHSNVQMIRTITQGNRKETCTIAFMALYYFTISNSIWWVVLTVTWFMTAALKWGQEPIEANSHYFHVFSWAVSLIMTLIALAMNKIEGDFLTGTCFIGIWNPSDLTTFVLIPLSFLLMVGFIFLVTGFISLWRTHSFIKMKKSRVTTLDKQVLRIGVYSVLYFVPTAILLGCFYYEQENVDSFLLNWLSSACKKPEYGIPCPSISSSRNLLSHGHPQAQISSQYSPKKPNASLYFIKYFVWLTPGIASGFWICTEKTTSTWTRVFRRIFCLEQAVEYV